MKNMPPETPKRGWISETHGDDGTQDMDRTEQTQGPYDEALHEFAPTTTYGVPLLPRYCCKILCVLLVCLLLCRKLACKDVSILRGRQGTRIDLEGPHHPTMQVQTHTHIQKTQTHTHTPPANSHKFMHRNNRQYCAHSFYRTHWHKQKCTPHACKKHDYGKVYTHVHVFSHIHTYTHINTYIIHTCIHVLIKRCANACIIHTYMHKFAHTCAQKHVCIYTNCKDMHHTHMSTKVFEKMNTYIELLE